MSKFKQDFPFRGFNREYHFKPTVWGEAVGNLNVNTDKLQHRPHDIVDHINRPRPLPSFHL